MGLVAGEQQTLHNLLYGLMLPSGNDAAMTIARYVGSGAKGTLAAARASRSTASKLASPIATFVGMMNARAASLGLKDSHFANPHGLDAPGHYSSAYDLASLTWYAMHFDTFDQIVRQPSYMAPGHPLININKMLARYPGAEGVKTGYTGAAGLCLVASATRNGHRLISVVLNAPRWYEDSAALLDYGFARLDATAPQKPTTGERLLVATRTTGR
jgi:D-alanyl-D-alanine carboxypeptidase